MATTCTHCPEHCPAPPGPEPDPDLALPPFPRRGGGQGRGVGTAVDRSFYGRLASVYRLARTRYPSTPAQAVLLANPGVTVEQLRRAVHRATGLGLLDRVRNVEPASVPAARMPRALAASLAAEPVAGEGPSPVPLQGTALEPAWTAGLEISRAALRRLVTTSEEETDALLELLVLAGGTRTADGVQPPA